MGTKKSAAKPNQVRRRVWIELEPPRDEVDARITAELANNMLKLARRDSNQNGDEFFWDERRGHWCYGGQAGYHELADNGEWFNLDYLGRP